MQKNDVVKVTIEDIGVNGEGIGKIDGYTLFIKNYESQEKLWICENDTDYRTVQRQSGAEV